MKQSNPVKQFVINRKTYEINGPYLEYSSPYGVATLCRQGWFVSRKLDPTEQATPIQKILGDKCLGKITRFKNQRRFIINNLFPSVSFTSLKKTVNYLVENEGKLVFCS